MAMKLSTGKVAFPIEFDNGAKETIYFNPNDPNLAIRLKDLQENVNKKMSEIEDIKLNNDGTPTDMKVIDDFEKIQNVLCNELDIAFGGDISSVVFKYCSPFAIVNGDYFLIQFIEAIKPEIEKHIKKGKADVEKKMAKHLNKYKK